jgi:hypothetical protein
MLCRICYSEIPPDTVTTDDGVEVVVWRKGHNAAPVVKGGRCCHDCNWRIVLTERLRTFWTGDWSRSAGAVQAIIKRGRS